MILLSALFNFQSLVVVILLAICTCTYIRHFTTALDANKTGLLSAFWKMARIGERLSPYVALLCMVMALIVLFGK